MTRLIGYVDAGVAGIVKVQLAILTERQDLKDLVESVKQMKDIPLSGTHGYGCNKDVTTQPIKIMKITVEEE